MKKVLAILILLAAMLIGCGSQNTPDGASDDDALVIAITRDENTLTPFTYVTGTPGLEVMRLVFDSLFTFDVDGSAIPWMVDEYTICAENRVYTMTLHTGQYWHDGTPLTADDVLFTFEYALTQTRARWRGIASQVESVVVSDGGVITLTLYRGNPDFLRSGLADMPIVARHIFENVYNASMYGGPTIGSSLFRLSEYRIGQYYVLEAVPNYFRGEPTVSRINMPIITDPAAVSQALISGQISAATRSISPETFSVFRAIDGLAIISGRGYSPTMLLFNCEHEILSNGAIRRAIGGAIDIEAIMNLVTLGYATPGQLQPIFCPDEIFAVLAEFDFDIDADGRWLHDGEPINFRLLVQSGNVQRIRAAELIGEYLAAVGVGITVVAMESDTVGSLVWPDFDVSQGRDFDMTMWGWSAATRLDPAFFVRVGASDPEIGDLNLSGFRSEDFDDRVREFLLSYQGNDRGMQVSLEVHAPFITLWYEDLNFAVNTGHHDGWILQQGTGIINRFSFLQG